MILGGLKGIMYMDAFQGAIMFAGMAFLILFTYSLLGGVQPAHEALANLPQMPGVAEQTANLAKGGFAGWTSMPRTGTPVWWNIVTTLIAGVGIGRAGPAAALREVHDGEERQGTEPRCALGRGSSSCS